MVEIFSALTFVFVVVNFCLSFYMLGFFGKGD